eukprot:gene6272-6511_t
MWTVAVADAACRLLRSAFPRIGELHNPELQSLLQQQLRLWTTGLLPSDATATCALAAAGQLREQSDISAPTVTTLSPKR